MDEEHPMYDQLNPYVLDMNIIDEVVKTVEYPRNIFVHLMQKGQLQNNKIQELLDKPFDEKQIDRFENILHIML